MKRIALNLDQVQQYAPPPNPAKVTDSRFAAYGALYGDESWELDALDPEVIIELIDSEIGSLRCDRLWQEATLLQQGCRDRLDEIVREEQVRGADSLLKRYREAEDGTSREL